MSHGQITPIDVPSDDLERAKTFYSELFGWKIQGTPEFPGYEMFHSGPGDMGGGIGLRGEAAPIAPRDYIAVDSIEATLAKVEGLGGSVVVEKNEVPVLAGTPPSMTAKIARAASGRVSLADSDPAGLRLVDSHAHLQADAFGKDRDAVLQAAYQAGLERLLIPAWDLPSTHAGLAFVRRHGLRTTTGIHPHVAATVTEAMWAEVCELAREHDVVGIGETGLDYDRGFSPREDQLANLRRHIELAYEVAEPLTLHCRSALGERDAQDDLIALLREGGAGSPEWRARFGGRPPGVLHSFSGPVDYAEAALEMGFFVAFGGLVFRRGEEASADVARMVPLERLLVETDSPYLKPKKVRGSRNQPLNVAVTASWLQGLRGDDPAVLGEALVDNFDLFVGASCSPEDVEDAPASAG